jgi:hypothetical protein
MYDSRNLPRNIAGYQNPARQGGATWPGTSVPGSVGRSKREAVERSDDRLTGTEPE